MVAEGEDDPEGAVLAAVRDIVGPAVPIAASLDLHANVTARMAAAADVLVGYRTYPHVDQRRTGERAAAPALAAAQGGPRPRTVVQKVPLIVPAETMQTTHGPMHEVRAEADWLEAEGAALAVSVFGMQPWLDLPEAGGSIVVVGTEPDEAHAHARRLARQFWQRRKAFDVPLVAPDAAVQRALAAERGPVLLVDSADSHLRRLAGRLRRRLAGAARRRLRPVGLRCERRGPLPGATRRPAGSRGGACGRGRRDAHPVGGRYSGPGA